MVAFCFLCRAAEESTTHLFWNCKKVKRIWVSCLPLTQDLFSLNRSCWDPDHYWQWMADKLGKEDLEIAIIILWSVWKHRNAVHQKESSPDSKLILRYIESYSNRERNSKNVHQSQENDPPPVCPKSLASHSDWIPPPANLWKLNVDASKSESPSLGGVGWILCDSLGSPICMGYKRIKEDWSVKWLEIKAIQEGIRSAYLT